MLSPSHLHRPPSCDDDDDDNNHNHNHSHERRFGRFRAGNDDRQYAGRARAPVDASSVDGGIPNNEAVRCPAAQEAGTSSSASASSPASGEGCVAYWMQRDVRVQVNYALSWAAHLASQSNVALRVYFALPPPPPSPTSDDDSLPPDLDHLPMTERHGKFLLGGLKCVHKELEELQVPLLVLRPS